MNKLVFIVITSLLLLAVAGCRKDTSNQKRYELTGKVLSVEPEKHQITVAHEDVKDYMPAMTMPFTLREDWPFKVLATGDRITATLVVDGTESWLEEIVITQESADTSAPGPGGVVEAQDGAEVPDFGLTNQSDQRIHLGQYRGKTLLLTFIYTRCPIPEYCTLMSQNFAQIESELAKQPELYQKTHLLSISIDPDYDTPAVLRSYGAAHTGKYTDEKFMHWEFATGTKDQVKGVAQFFGLRYYADQDQIVHGLRTIIINPEGRVVKVYRDNSWKPEEVLAELRKLQP
ncbi:MAG TPA: SCO family protein [Pyrinomonadaceae bacterium]|nr:SCO family protein [Pyrinomonadaceae bacterium]